VLFFLKLADSAKALREWFRVDTTFGTEQIRIHSNKLMLCFVTNLILLFPPFEYILTR